MISTNYTTDNHVPVSFDVTGKQHLHSANTGTLFVQDRHCGIKSSCSEWSASKAKLSCPVVVLVLAHNGKNCQQ